MKNIKERREARHQSQEDLAAKANVSRVSIARYEAGERIPSVDIAARIAAALGCTVDELLDKETAQGGQRHEEKRQRAQANGKQHETKKEQRRSDSDW